MGPDSVKHQLNGDVNESSEELTGEASECVAPALGQEGSPGSERGGRECEQVEAAALPVPPVWWGAFPPSHLPVTVLGRPCSSQSPGQACPGDSVGGRSFTGSPASALREPCRVSGLARCHSWAAPASGATSPAPRWKRHPTRWQSPASPGGVRGRESGWEEATGIRFCHLMI